MMSNDFSVVAILVNKKQNLFASNFYLKFNEKHTIGKW